MKSGISYLLLDCKLSSAVLCCKEKRVCYFLIYLLEFYIKLTKKIHTTHNNSTIQNTTKNLTLSSHLTKIEKKRNYTTLKTPTFTLKNGNPPHIKLSQQVPPKNYSKAISLGVKWMRQGRGIVFMNWKCNLAGYARAIVLESRRFRWWTHEKSPTDVKCFLYEISVCRDSLFRETLINDSLFLFLLWLNCVATFF